MHIESLNVTCTNTKSCELSIGTKIIDLGGYMTVESIHRRSISA